MSDLSLTQSDLNVSYRGLTDVDILMYLPDKNIYFPSNAVTVNGQSLAYTSNLKTVVELSSLPQANIATFENNSWILDGSFVSPSEAYGGGGDSYTGYIANDLTDDDGNYTTNPVLKVALSAVAPEINYISLKFAGGIDTSYPKSLKIRTYNNSDTLIKEHTFTISEQTTMPLLTAQIGDVNVKRVEFELVGTVCPHRRVRLNKIMFGKAEQIDGDYIQSWKVEDKASLVADSLPSKTLTFSIINYERDYDVDNPGNKIPSDYNDALILFTLGMEDDNLWKYAPTKTFNLTDISTSSDGLVTFTCGSLLDVLTDTYDHDVYTGKRTIKSIMPSLINFSGIAIAQYNLGEFGDYEINSPLPESPVREIIQKLAFSCGATLTVSDDNVITFSSKNIVPTSSTPKFVFTPPDDIQSAAILIEEPTVEALSYTKNIAMYTYDSVIDDDASNVGTANITSVNSTRITFSAVSGAISFDEQEVEDQGATISSISESYSQHALITVAMGSSATPPIKVTINGRKVTTTQTSPKNANSDTLLLDSGLALTVPTNLKRPANPDAKIFYYDDWYGAKFKYKCTTRKEYLVKAGDIIYFETPFSNGVADRVGYVLSNTYSTDDTGEMEVILIGNN